MSDPKPFRYCADPICVGSVALYLVNRWFLKPHGWGGAFTQGYLNDVLCLPLFLPLILYVQRMVGLRGHHRPPSGWELVQHWVVFSIVFEVVIPRWPDVFHTTADPLDVVAYLVGGLLAQGVWRVMDFGAGKEVASLAGHATAQPDVDPAQAATNVARFTVFTIIPLLVSVSRADYDRAVTDSANRGAGGIAVKGPRSGT